MTPFKFSLGRVLQLRERAEREAALNLARAKVVEQEAKAETEAAHERTREASEALSKTPGSVTTIGELHPIHMLRHSLGLAASHAAEAEEAASAQVADDAQSLGKAMQARRVLDRLHEKQLDVWKAGAAREDLATMDEVARVRAALDDSNRRS